MAREHEDSLAAAHEPPSVPPRHDTRQHGTCLCAAVTYSTLRRSPNERPAARACHSRPRMRYTIETVDGCLRAELVGRETADHTREFLAALAREALAGDHTRLLIVVRKSRTIFQVEKYGISQWFRQLAEKPGVRVALVADSSELRAAHDYIQMLARQQKANVRAFHDEAAARDWLVPGKPVEQAQPAGRSRLRT